MMTRSTTAIGQKLLGEGLAPDEGDRIAAGVMPLETDGQSQPSPCQAPPTSGTLVAVIPVGQEPPPQRRGEGDGIPADARQADTGGDPAGARTRKTPRGKSRNSRPVLMNPDGFYKYKNRLDEQRVFRAETMRYLRRAEITVWHAIHGCQHNGAARISQKRIAELAGIKGKRHVVDTIKSLRAKGLLEVLSQGRYRPNGADGHGLSSVYRVYPRPEPRLLNPAPDGEISPGGDGPQKPAVTKPANPRKPR